MGVCSTTNGFSPVLYRVKEEKGEDVLIPVPTDETDNLLRLFDSPDIQSVRFLPVCLSGAGKTEPTDGDGSFSQHDLPQEAYCERKQKTPLVKVSNAEADDGKNALSFWAENLAKEEGKSQCRRTSLLPMKPEDGYAELRATCSKLTEGRGRVIKTFVDGDNAFIRQRQWNPDRQSNYTWTKGLKRYYDYGKGESPPNRQPGINGKRSPFTTDDSVIEMIPICQYIPDPAEADDGSAGLAVREDNSFYCLKPQVFVLGTRNEMPENDAKFREGFGESLRKGKTVAEKCRHTKVPAALVGK